MERVEQIYEAPVDEIVVQEGRMRREFDQKKLRRLANSFKERGQKQPGICRREDEKIILVAGERRLKACEMIGIPFKFVLDEVGKDNTYEIKKIEFEENVCRVDLTWLERANGIEELHKLEQSYKGVARAGVHGGHGVRDTAKIVNEAVGTVVEDLKLAAFARQSAEVRNAKTRSEAKKIVKRLEEKLTRFERFEAAVKTSEVPPEESKLEAASVEQQLVFYGKRIKLGKMEEVLPEFPDQHFDVVCFDPPWRVGLDEVRKKGGGTDDFEDAVVDSGSFKRELTTWLYCLFRKMATDSHLYLFFGMVNHREVYESLEQVGFTVNKIPLIWYKQGAHVIRTPDVWPGRSYEPIAFARKGSKALVKKGAPDVLLTPAPTPPMKKNHPSVKHPMLYMDLLQRSCYPGDRILDPMCGSGMFGVAAEALEPSLKLDWVMIEKVPDFRRLSIANVVDGFASIMARREIPLETEEESTDFEEGKYTAKSEVEDFRELKPGSDRWRIYWSQHPEKQEEMLEWRQKTKK